MDGLQRRIQWLVKHHGSYRLAAKFIGTDHAYLAKIFYGQKHPSRQVLAKLGLVKVVSYRSNKP